MPKYDNYNPEINYTEESLPLETAVQEEKKVPERRQRPSKQKPTKQRPKKENKTVEKEKNSVAKESLFRKTVDWFRSPYARILWGIFMGCITIYLAVSFVSYFNTCILDQSKLATSIGEAKDIANAGGEGGARLAEFLINEGFGLGALVIIIWTGAISLKILVGRPKFNTLSFTIKCLVALITVSLIIGLITYSVHTPVNWGGYHGTYVNEFIIHFIGSIGAVLLSIFMLALFIVICLRDLVNWIIRTKRKHDLKRKIAAEEKAARLAREEELRRVQEQTEQDELRAAGETDGESTVSIYDNEDEHLEFSTTDAGIYELPEDEEPVPGLALRDNSDTSISGELTSKGIDTNVTEDIDTRVTEYKEPTIGTDSDESQNPADNRMPEDIMKPLDNHLYEREDDYLEGEKVGDEIIPDASASSDEDNPDANPGDRNAEKSSGAAEDTSTEEEKQESMVVNVNSIGQSGNSRFKPDIVHYEEQRYKFPPFDLLRQGVTKVSVDVEEQAENKRKIEKTLLDFGIPITQIEATVGPTVTLYEIVPDTGVKIAKIRSLVDDIALSLSATGVRIIAPIPGKGTVGIEVANKDKQTVSMRTIINSNKYQNSRYELPVALGSTISNDVYIADLAKMPHLLVAGATGQGKSVGLNAIIASLLYCKAPHELKFVMIDPKQVEFSLYNKLKNYYLASIPGEEEEPVITEMSKVEATLNSLCIEMEQRYSLLKAAETRNIEEYNRKIREGVLNPGKGHRFLPYIVVVVDEFGDLKMVLGNNVEMPIARLAQKARAVGMHVIIATQRPSTNVITGIIKANFPARISFKVTSGVDSKTILDTPGAQQLIGRGDMLIFNNSEMVRVQCAFIDTPEVAAICEYIEHQPYPQGVYLLPEPNIDNGDSLGESQNGPVGDRDALFVEVARAIVKTGKASTSAVQRHFEIGFNRAGRIMDQLEKAGIVGPAQGGKPRVLLMTPMELEDYLATL
ncbi:MAG: DNA translocase FtsK [Muribaculaceae bacterium]|nr:DNA translocase FtsK [Muribaculaceae bacterium]